MNIDWDKIGKILGSKGFENVAGVAGAGVSAYANAKTQQQSQQQQADQFAVQTGQNAETQRLNRATAAAGASPLGANEDYAHRNALRLAVLSNMRQPSVVATDPGVRAATPQITSAFQLPAGGFSKETLAHLSPSATAGAIAQRQKHISNIAPNAPGVDFSRMGFGEDAIGSLQQDTQNYQLAGLEEQKLQAALARQQNVATPAPEKKKSGFWGKVGGVLKVAAPVAAAFIPGVGPLAAAAIAGGGTALGSKMQGQSLGSSLKSGAGAAATGALGAVGKGATAGAKGLSGVNAASKWGAAANVAQSALAPATRGQIEASRGVDPQVLMAALRKQQFNGR